MALTATALAAGLLTATSWSRAAPAAATSCATPSERDALRTGRTVLVGRWRGAEDFDVDWSLGVHASPRERVRYEDPMGGAAGPPTGTQAVLVHREGGTWVTGPCSHLDPARLHALSGPVPAPDGTGPVAAVAATGLRTAGLVLLDADGRPLGYGGRDVSHVLDVCPGGRRVLVVRQTAYDDHYEHGDPNLARWEVRDLATLDVVREGHAPRLFAGLCTDPAGDDLTLALGHGGPHTVVRDTPTGDTRLATGALRDLGARDPRDPTRSLVLGSADGPDHGPAAPVRLRSLDLRTGAATDLADLPPGASGKVAVSPDGRRVAVVGSVPEPGQDIRRPALWVLDRDTPTAPVTAELPGAVDAAWAGDHLGVAVRDDAWNTTVVFHDTALRETHRVPALAALATAPGAAGPGRLWSWQEEWFANPSSGSGPHDDGTTTTALHVLPGDGSTPQEVALPARLDLEGLTVVPTGPQPAAGLRTAPDVSPARHDTPRPVAPGAGAKAGADAGAAPVLTAVGGSAAALGALFVVFRRRRRR
ncbi:hypothetical protein NUM3379_03140 [Kineococcus sp. NUM-3379]